MKSPKHQLLSILTEKRERKARSLEGYARLCLVNSPNELMDGHAQHLKGKIQELDNMIKWVGLQKE